MIRPGGVLLADAAAGSSASSRLLLEDPLQAGPHYEYGRKEHSASDGINYRQQSGGLGRQIMNHLKNRQPENPSLPEEEC
ncbi:hypothetical protein NDU88_005768 [Pleurodeles waltl]|uniref:Uncharacterized protein n=1 Tax=Pleurodeles waltl TaxID=8319 RepID=A0AAV7WBH2_PLEWA|nr:hypothetical protein NDU88_005768 [Pleurodeles waltl]